MFDKTLVMKFIEAVSILHQTQVYVAFTALDFCEFFWAESAGLLLFNEDWEVLNLVFFISLQGTAAVAEWSFCGLSTIGEDDNGRPRLVCAGAFPDLFNALATWL